MRTTSPAASPSTTALQAVARYGYVPSMLIGLNGAGIAVAAAGAPKYWLVAILAVAIATGFLVERIIPYDPEWNHDRADGTRDRIHVAVISTVWCSGCFIRPLRP